MRLWSIHPKYLDPQGLVALWREGLLAKNVLENKTVGYKNHPQLIRFRNTPNPIKSIHYYLCCICEEASCRGYRFDKEKICWDYPSIQIPVTKGQINYEGEWLRNKLKVRNPSAFLQIADIESFEPHPMFTVVAGAVEHWEKH